MKYLIIVGGQLHNKGAQAMTFTVVDEIRKRFPNKKIALFASIFNERDLVERESLNFKVLPWSIGMKMKILGKPYSHYVGIKRYLKQSLINLKISKNQMNDIIKILNNADLMIDVSGYALSSQRGYYASINYIYNIIIAKKFNIPMYLLPQSIGPFNYKNTNNTRMIDTLIKQFLSYPKKIFVREKDGLKQLQKYNLTNIDYSLDCVLQNSSKYQLKNIFTTTEINNIRDIEIQLNSVAIIPNEKIMVHGNSEEIYKIYKFIINKLLEQNLHIYLIRHSVEDFNICKKIKSEFENNEKVILIEDDLNCIEIENMLSKFNFVIASRYHSIIHSYKRSVPAIVFGWAIKYQELLSEFKQENYLFDVRNNINIDDVNKKLELMLLNYKKEKELIEQKVNLLQTNNIFDQIEIR